MVIFNEFVGSRKSPNTKSIIGIFEFSTSLLKEP